MKTMPPVTGASGHATMLSNRFVVAIDEGTGVGPAGW